jgi:hypothetical protein
VSIGELRLKLPAMIDVAAASQRNVLVRPHGAGVAFIQQARGPAPAVFLILRNLPRKFSGMGSPARQ